MKPNIFIITGKNPLISKGGYASYARILHYAFHQLGYQVVFVTPPTFLLKFPFLRDAPMIALLPLSLILLPSLTFQLRSKSYPVIWGIGPWGLAGGLLKLFFPKIKFTLIADYFTTIQHEFAAARDVVLRDPYPVFIKFQTAIAAITLVPFYTLLEKFLLSRSNSIVTHYRSTEMILTKQFHVSPTRFDRLSVPMAVLKRVGRRPVAPPLVVTIGRHDPRKGIFDLLQAFHLLNQKKLHYSAVIVGSGPLLEFHRRQIRNLHLHNVSLPGSVPDITPYLEKASVFVLPSLEEGSSSLALVEAMQAGLPIVATRVDGIAEDITHNKSGLLVPANNPKALANAIKKIITNPRFGRRLGQKAKQSYFQKHNPTNTRHAIKKFLTNLERN